MSGESVNFLLGGINTVVHCHLPLKSCGLECNGEKSGDNGTNFPMNNFQAVRVHDLNMFLMHI